MNICENTSLTIEGEYRNEFRRPFPRGGTLYARFNAADEDSIRRAIKYVGGNKREADLIVERLGPAW